MRTSVSLVLTVSLACIFGCQKQQSMDNPTEQPAVAERAPESGPILGRVLGRQFKPSRVILEDNVLTLRQGEDFFADIKVQIFLFLDSDKFSGKTIDVSAGQTYSNPHIHFGVRAEGEDMMKTEAVTDGYDMVISFGEAEQFGIPFSVSLDIQGEHNVALVGQSFATFGDLKLVNGKPDMHYDSLDMLDYVAREFLRPQHPAIDSFAKFAGRLTHYTKQPFPKEGFYGYAAGVDDGKTPVLKVQMYKDEEGWAVHTVLGENQIPQAHPIGKFVRPIERYRVSKLAELATALKMEQDLNTEGEMHNVRSTDIRCREIDQSEKEGSATCLSSIGIQRDETVECTRRNYLLSRNGDQWTVEKQIGEDLRLDHNTRELVEKKDYGMGCG